MAKRSKPGRPRKIERGVVVNVINARTGRAEDRAIVMKRDKPYDPYTPAEFVVCSLKRGRPHVFARSPGLIVPVGRVKKMPKVCRDALKKGPVY